MIILALDTAGPDCTVSLVDSARILAHRSDPIGRGHAEHLAPMLGACLKQASLKPRDIDKISVCTGPGSFTGLRIALACAKGFALPHNIPVVGLSAFHVWAATQDPQSQKRIITVSDIRRGELCWALYDKGQCVQAPLTQSAEQARATISKLEADHVLEECRTSGPVLAWLAQSCDPNDFPATPLYSRPPDAKLPKPRRPKQQPVTRRLKKPPLASS